MLSLLKHTNNFDYMPIYGCLDKVEDCTSRLQEKYIAEQVRKYPKIDPTLIAMLVRRSDFERELEYFGKNYDQFKQVLDSGFPNKLIKKGAFQSHVWEMILCDVLSSYGELQPKKEKGADIRLLTKNGQDIQIEAVVAKESDNPSLRSVKPRLSPDRKFDSLSGKVDDLENPVLLRFTAVFSEKASDKNLRKDLPLILAINTSQAVGFTSRDDYIIRRALFGLGSETITRINEDNYRHGLQQKTEVQKGDASFSAAFFRQEKYSHISGVIYSSQSPHSLTPTGTGWLNSGLVYAANPLAENPAEIYFDCMGKIIVTEEKYEEVAAQKKFLSCL